MQIDLNNVVDIINRSIFLKYGWPKYYFVPKTPLNKHFVITIDSSKKVCLLV